MFIGTIFKTKNENHHEWNKMKKYEISGFGPDTALIRLLWYHFLFNKNPASEKKSGHSIFFWNSDLKYWFFEKKQYQKKTFYLSLHFFGP
jgi:hypothetical protein